MEKGLTWNKLGSEKTYEHVTEKEVKKSGGGREEGGRKEGNEGPRKEGKREGEEGRND